MAKVAVWSTGPLNNPHLCRTDVLTFLQDLSWHIAAVDVKLWTPDGLPLASRKWEPGTMDLCNLAEEIAHFITHSVAGAATVLLRRASAPEQ